MGLIRQTWTLTEKTLIIVVLRNWLGTLIRAFLAPIIFIFIISYAKNFFVPPSEFGIGSPTALRSFSEALSSSAGGRDTFVFVNNGFTGGDIETVIDQLSQTVTASGLTARVLESPQGLVEVCPSTIRGVSPCFAALQFDSSPNEGGMDLPIWNYTIRADGALGGRVYVNDNNNDHQIYALPLQHAVDDAIAQLNGSSLPAANEIQQYPYTDETAQEREDSINEAYMDTLISILGVAYFIGSVGICYQLTGQMAQEREMGMSQLLEAMMPNKLRWTPQVARLMSLHIAFDLVYLPSWIIMGAIVSALNYTQSNIGVLIGYYIMSGFALSSWSVGFAALFRKAQLSGITVVIVSILMAIVVQVVPPSDTATVTVTTLLFAPINFVMFIIYMAYWQRERLAVDLMQGPPTSPWQTPGYLFFIFCAIQIVAYPIIGAFIERSLYGTASKARTLKYGEESGHETVKINQLTKHYPPSFFKRMVGKLSKHPKQTVVAVDNVDLTVLKGQIMVLLGANGSGKSTSLDMMAGLQSPTGGTIEMDASGGIGLCPQKNVLWDELTVIEHVRIFNRLKATSLDDLSTMKDLITSCDLQQKVNAVTGSLSGGQKRKVQMCMMLTGGSALCMLDEVSSGLDPLSRRKIWDILLAERGKRSIVLTTHFLDEADLLSDDITILSKGNLVANGSAVALKSRLGGGYRVRIYHEDAKPLPAELEQGSKQVLYDQTVYQLHDSGEAARFVAELERIGVRDYQVNGPTIEDVFLKLASEVKQEMEVKPAPRSSSPSSDEPTAAQQEKGLQLVSGKNISFLQQTWVLFRKRFTILKGNQWPYLVALLLPIIAAGLVTLFLTGFEVLTCDPGAQTEVDAAISLAIGGAEGDVPAGPPSAVPTNFLTQLFPILQQSEPFVSVNSLEAMNEYIAANFSSAEPGGIWAGDIPTFAWRGNYQMSYAIMTQNLLDTSLLESPIITNFQAFAAPWAPSAGDTLQLVLYFGLAMSVFPGFAALYVNLERCRNVRALHYSNGVRAGPLWLAYTLTDSITVLLVAAVTIIIFTAVSDVFYAPGYLFVVFALYGLSATLMSYVVSLFTTSQLATFAFAAGGQCCLFLIYFISFMVTITYAPAASVDSFILYEQYGIGLFFPAGNLLRSLLLTFNLFSLLCRNNSKISYPGDWDAYGSPICYLVIQSVISYIFLVWWDSGYKPAFLNRKKHRDEDPEEIEGVDPEVSAETKRVDEGTDELRVLHARKAFGPNVAVQDITFGVPRGEVFGLLGPNGAGKSTTIGLIRGDTRPSDKSSEILIEGTSIIRHRAAARANLGVCPQFDAMDQMTAIEHLRFYARARGVPDVENNVAKVVEAVGLEPFKTRMAAKLSGGNKRKLSLGIALMGNPSVLLLDEPSSGMDAASKRVMWKTLTAVSSGRSLIITTHSMEEADALADRAGIMARRMLALGTADQLRKRHGDAYHVHLVHKDAPHTSEADMQHIKDFIKQALPGAQVEDRSFHGQLRFSVPNNSSLSGTSTPSKNEKSAVLDEKTEQPAGAPQRGISALFAQLEANKENLGFEYYSVSQATLDQVFLSIVGKHNVQEENYRQEHNSIPTFWQKTKLAIGGGNGILCFY